MASLFPTLHKDIVALDPWGDGKLFADAAHCLDFDEQFDAEAKAQALLPTTGTRPATALKVRAKTFQLFLTIHDMNLQVPSAFGLTLLRAVFDLDKPITRMAEVQTLMHRVAFAKVAGVTEPIATLAGAMGVSERKLFNWRADPGYAAHERAVTAHVSSAPAFGQMFGHTHPLSPSVREAGGVERLARKVVAHMRTTRSVSDEDRFAIFLLFDWCRWATRVPPEELIMALGYACGVIDARSGRPVDKALAFIMGTRDLERFRQRAIEDGQAPDGHRPRHWHHDEPDRAVTNWRRLGSYKSLSSGRP